MAMPKSSTIDKSDERENAEQRFTHSKGVVSYERINLQNVLLIWLDNNIDESTVDSQNSITQLRHTVNSINTFTDLDQCVDFLTDIYDENVCMIISDALCQNLVPFIHTVAQLRGIFIFRTNKTQLEQWAQNWPKVKGIFTEIAPICEALKQTAQACEQNSIPISFITTSDDISEKKLDQLEPTFMYTQILKEILLSIDFKEKHFMEFIEYCRNILVDNEFQLKNVDKLKREYSNEKSIWWYTYECFLYPMLNRALRKMDVDIIIKIAFFICDLHRRIQQLYNEQFTSNNSRNKFMVYRGQGMWKNEFQQMKKNKGGLISFNNFLSTSENRDIPFLLAESNSANIDLVGIIFAMTIDPFKSSVPFASVSSFSQFEVEDEVLFSMHSVFRIDDIKPIGENDRLFQVELTLTSDNDKDLHRLTNHIREETFPDAPGWSRLAFVLLKMGQLHKAQHVSEILLEQATDENDKASIYDQLGQIKFELAEYKEAITFFQRSAQIKRKYNPLNLHNISNYHSHIANVYYGMGDYPKALLSYEKALAIKQQLLPPNHPNLAFSYSNIGNLHGTLGDYRKALPYFEKALAISQKILLPNHPDLGSYYNNIGSLYAGIGEYAKALSYFEKALAIQQQSLPPNHHDFADTYNNIGIAHKNLDDYPKALSSYEKALAIQQQSFPPNHPGFASLYNKIGSLHERIDEDAEALSYYEKALAIQQEIFPPNHPDLAHSYDTISTLYGRMDEYAKALPYCEKALGIQQQLLSPNHHDLARLHYNIGYLYENMSIYSKAYSSYKHAVDIGQYSLPPNDPELLTYQQHLVDITEKLGCC
jgi:tetratricopeptide (TPR) repeat protein